MSELLLAACHYYSKQAVLEDLLLGCFLLWCWKKVLQRPVVRESDEVRAVAAVIECRCRCSMVKHLPVEKERREGRRWREEGTCINAQPSVYPPKDSVDLSL